MTNKEIEKYEQRALEIARMPNSKEFYHKRKRQKIRYRSTETFWRVARSGIGGWRQPYQYSSTENSK